METTINNENITLENSEIIDERSSQERLSEIATDAIARLDVLKDFFNLARQFDDAEANISDAIKLQSLTETTAQVISTQLSLFLADAGVHISKVKEFDND